MNPGPICRTTRQGPGCGHPTADHDANPMRDCPCCARAKVIEILAGGLNRSQRRKMERLVRRR